jgi:LuxR family maltose regulon positive regulatory protein
MRAPEEGQVPGATVERFDLVVPACQRSENWRVMVARVPRSKTAVPDLPPEFVPRPALLTALDDGENSSLTLVCAPPGYGKTLLLSDWVQRSDEACAWVALDEDDDDPRRLWTSVLAALKGCQAVPPSSRLRDLVVPRTVVGVDFLTDLFQALDEVPLRIRLVLDDAHHLRAAETLHGLHLLVRHRLAKVRLVLASRVDPALPVARLRMEDRLCELRTAELSFSTEETGTLAEHCGLTLTGGESSLLNERTQGWPAGIRLAAMPLRGHPDPSSFLDAFSGDERPVADYLADEVLSTISEEQRELLRRTSISDPLLTPLAVELSGRPDAGDMLSSLAHSTGLVAATGPHRTEFRFSELMRSYLLADLHRQGPKLAAELHRRAAEWWSAAGRPVQALRHAAQSGNSALLSGLLHQWAAELVAQGEHTELRRAMEAIEPEQASTDAWLPLIAAQMHLATGDRVAARADVRRARAVQHGSGDLDLTYFRAATAEWAGADDPSLDPITPPGDTALAALTLAGRGVAQLSAISALDPAVARTVLDELEAALALTRDRHLGLLEVQCLCLIGTAALGIGDHKRAAAASWAAISAATAQGWHELAWTAAAHAVLAHAHLAQGFPAHALDVSIRGLAIAPAKQDPVIRFALRCARGGALCDGGDMPAGLLELQEAQAQMGGAPVPLPLAAWAALLEHRAALLLGLPAAAASSLGRLTDRSGAEAELALMHSWSEAAAGSPGAARATVAPLLNGNVRPALHSTSVEAWLVEAWGAQRLGDQPAGRHAVQAALVRAEPLDLVRPFAVAGRGLRVLLVDQLGGVRIPSTFAFRCLVAGRRPHEPLATPLSARERDVLAQLVSLSNLGEIADDLAVSVNTVKSHVRAIYGKLGVSSRRAAVLTALEHDVLT